MTRQAKKPQTRKSIAQERFTDRRDPVKVFEEKYDEIKQEQGSFDVIHYYGEGGIGKSALLCKIMDDQIEYGHKNVIIYSFKANQDKTKFLHVLARQIAARIDTADFTLFYYAYAKYLKECGMSDTQIEAEIKDGDNTGIVVSETAKTAISVVTDLLPFGGNTVGKTGELLVDFISRCISDERRNGKREDKEAIYKIDKSGMDELEKEMQGYFATDCHKFMNDIAEPFSILLDDYEYMNDRVKHGHSHEDLWLCDACDGLVNYLPNTLWVIAGRDRINWSEEVLPAENCHLLGALGGDDASDFFRKARDPKGNPIDPDLITGLYNLTKGIPVYMDMCFGQFEKGHCHQLEDYGRNTEEIAERYFKDREPEERTAIEFLCGLTSIWSDKMRKTVLNIVESDEPYDVSLQLKLKGIKEQTYVERIGDQYKIHDVYRKVVRDNMNQDELKKISDATYSYLADKVNDEELSMLERVDVLRQLDQDIEDYLLIEDDIRDTILYNSWLLEDMGRYYEFHELASKLVSVYRVLVDVTQKNDTRIKVIDAQEILVSSLKCIGNYKEALFYANKVYEQRLNLLSEDHPDTISAKDNLGGAYYDIGEYVMAQKLYEEVLKKRTEILGENDPDTLRAKSNFAATLENAGEYAKAQKLYEEVLEKLTEILGENDPDTLIAKFNLAITCYYLGEYAKTLKLQQEILGKQAEVLGEDHPDTLKSKRLLAGTYNKMNEFAKAQKLVQEVLEKQVEVLGEDHPDTLITKTNLALTYDEMGEYEKALKQYEEVMGKLSGLLGENHPDTIGAKANLALLYDRIRTS